jgi:arginine/lysine/ornithine decarboxylase
MAERGEALLGQVIELATAVRSAIGDIGGMRVLGDELLGEGRSDELDPLKIVIDVSGLGIEGYQATDWLRDNRHVHMGLSDHRRTTAQLNVGDDESTTGPLLDALRALASAAGSLPAPVPVELPEPGELELENVMPPREAFFGPAEQVPAERADGRVAAEMVTPYPPGIPAIAPGERITAKVVAYLRSGVAAGMYIPDAADPSIGSLRVVSNSS